jgi:predicted acyl esterase
MPTSRCRPAIALRGGLSPSLIAAPEHHPLHVAELVVLVYQTAPLDEDVTVAGPIEADLLVSTSGTDPDWVVKLIDVYPGDFPDPEQNPSGVRMGGYQQLVRGDVIRVRFRHALDKPESFEPGEPTRVCFRLQDVLHTFRPGHRIMVHVQSTWFPLVDLNPSS